MKNKILSNIMAIFVIISNSALFPAALSQAGKTSSLE